MMMYMMYTTTITAAMSKFSNPCPRIPSVSKSQPMMAAAKRVTPMVSVLTHTVAVGSAKSKVVMTAIITNSVVLILYYTILLNDVLQI